MAQINSDTADQLARIKKNIETSYKYFNDNYKRFREAKRYVYKETINQKQRSLMEDLGRPVVEFNLGAAAINRLLGEFADHEPGIEVSPAEGVPVNQQVLDVVEGSIRSAIYQANKNSFSRLIYKDELSGSFSVGKVWTDYASSMSMNQSIYWGHVFDATLVGFDPLARASHKGDGQYSFEIAPMTEEDFKREYPDVAVADLNYLQDVGGFSWSYKDSENNKIVLVCDYYEKKKKKTKIVKIADGQIMTAKNYKKMQEIWAQAEMLGEIIEQMPIVTASRMTTLETICNYKLIGSKIISYEETDYSYLPHVFFDGNSEILTNGPEGASYQFCTPYYYHARGAQDMMNFSGMALANNTENLSMAQFIIKKEAIPQEQDYIDMITTPQKGGTIVVNAFNENNPDQPIPDPIRLVEHAPLPPEVMGAFSNSVGLIQAILGGMSSNPSNDQNYISGKAIVESIAADNATAMPFVDGYLAGLTQMAQIHVDLMPKYILGKRTIPIIKKNGEKIAQDVNTEGMPALNYQQGAIKVNVEAGVNFKVQQDKALNQLIGLMQASPGFAEFMNSEEGLKILVKNLNIYSADELQEAVPKWVQQQAQQKQEAMKMQQEMAQQDPRMIKAQADVKKVQIDERKQQVDEQQQSFDNYMSIAEQAREDKLADAKVIETESKVSQSEINSLVRLEESQTSLEVHALEAATKIAEIHSREHDKALSLHASHLSERELEHKINILESKNQGEKE